MLRSTKELNNFTIRGTDGEVGHVDDFYFDDEKWTIRYMVVATGGWLGRRVLISPISFSSMDWHTNTIDLSLTRDRVRNSPDADLNAPISRAYERGYYGYYGYPPYWGGMGYWGPAEYPGALAGPGAVRTDRASTAAAVEERADSHVRSCNAVMGYHIHATNGEIGHVDDFIFDDERWAIRYLRVDTSNWIGGKPVLVPQAALREVNWIDARINVALTKDQVWNSPEFDPGLLNRDGYVERLETHYRSR
jgi:hypothetical protein